MSGIDEDYEKLHGRWGTPASAGPGGYDRWDITARSAPQPRYKTTKDLVLGDMTIPDADNPYEKMDHNALNLMLRDQSFMPTKFSSGANGLDFPLDHVDPDDVW
jgi:hypothetical protein